MIRFGAAPPSASGELDTGDGIQFIQPLPLDANRVGILTKNGAAIALVRVATPTDIPHLPLRFANPFLGTAIARALFTCGVICYRRVMKWRLSPEFGGFRSLMTILFVFWGLGGFVVILIGIVSSGALAAAMVGAAGGVLWIGGMVFFGIGALLGAPTYTLSDVRSNGAFKGVKYREMVDYSIQIDTDEGVVTYPNLAAFRNDIKARG